MEEEDFGSPSEEEEEEEVVYGQINSGGEDDEDDSADDADGESEMKKLNELGEDERLPFVLEVDDTTEEDLIASLLERVCFASAAMLHWWQCTGLYFGPCFTCSTLFIVRIFQLFNFLTCSTCSTF